jgi:hypothetical protein
MAIVLTNGDDTYTATVDEDTDVEALAGNDTITITAEGDLLIRLYGDSGNDALRVSSKGVQAELYGGGGNDSLVLDIDDGGLARGGDGDDYIEVVDHNSITSYSTIFGDAGNDVLHSDDFGEAHGGAGSDIIGDAAPGYNNGSRGDGGAGDDIIYSSHGDGGSGDDQLSGWDIGQGEAGFDLLKVWNSAFGGSGSDVFFPFLNLSPDDGGTRFSDHKPRDFQHGVDRLATRDPIHLVDARTGKAGEAVSGRLSENQFYVAVDLDGDQDIEDIFWTTGRLQVQQSDFILQTLEGTDGADVKRGSGLDELMLGNGGDDLLEGLHGDDWLFGGFGADTVQGGAGDDLLVGGAGDDFVSGSSGEDTISAGDGADRVSAGGGIDSVEGGAGDDVLAGGDGDDTLKGGAGKDRLNGGAGNDVLVGGTGADYLLGGEGADTFVFAPPYSGLMPGQRDQIGDFTSGEDHIDLIAFGPAAITISDAGAYSLVEIDVGSDMAIDARIRVNGAIDLGDIWLLGGP